MRIDLRDFSIAFGSRHVFDHVSTSLVMDAEDDDARVIGLMGPSGSGKTTLARHILSARYDGERAGLEVNPVDCVIAYLPQTAVLFPHLTVYRNARLFEGVGRYRSRFDSGLFGQLASVLRLETLLTSRSSVEQLSGGEAQRLMLLRTLSVRPDLLVLDEPASGLDPAVKDALLVDLQDVLRQLRICALYISHHWAEVAFLAGRVAFTELGRGLQRPVRALPIMSTDAFRTKPPSIDAFLSIHGPGCSIWPVRSLNTVGQARVACFPAPFQRASAFRHAPPDYRLSEALLSEINHTPINAAIYIDDRFSEHMMVERNQLVGDLM